MAHASVYRRRQQLVWDILDGDPTTASGARWVDLALLWLIVLNVLAAVLGTVPAVDQVANSWLSNFELFSVLVFSLEYVLRVWSVTATPAYSRPVLGRLRYVCTPLAVVDLLAVLPVFVGLGADLRFLRIFRAFRLLRIAKLGRYMVALRLVGSVIHEKRRELVAVGATLFVLLLVSSSILYYVEHDAQPEKFASIPDAMWWGIATMTTVGYGDVYPVTGLGRLVAGLLAVAGIAFFALPAAIITAGFMTHMAPAELAPGSPTTEKASTCPHCGGRVNEAAAPLPASIV